MKRKSQIINHESAAAIGNGTDSFELRRSDVRSHQSPSRTALQAVEQFLCIHTNLDVKLTTEDKEELAELLESFAKATMLRKALNLKGTYEQK